MTIVCGEKNNFRLYWHWFIWKGYICTHGSMVLYSDTYFSSEQYLCLFSMIDLVCSWFSWTWQFFGFLKRHIFRCLNCFLCFKDVCVFKPGPTPLKITFFLCLHSSFDINHAFSNENALHHYWYDWCIRTPPPYNIAFTIFLSALSRGAQ